MPRSKREIDRIGCLFVYTTQAYEDSLFWRMRWCDFSILVEDIKSQKSRKSAVIYTTFCQIISLLIIFNKLALINIVKSSQSSIINKIYALQKRFYDIRRQSACISPGNGVAFENLITAATDLGYIAWLVKDDFIDHQGLQMDRIDLLRALSQSIWARFYSVHLLLLIVPRFQIALGGSHAACGVIH